jgi:hypothetical protein
MSNQNYKCDAWCITRILIAILLAYPLCGLAIALRGLLATPYWSIHHPLEALEVIAAIIVWYGIATPISGGFPITDEAGIQRMNAYPYIAATAVALCFIFFRGWRWFRYAVIPIKNKPVAGWRPRSY